MIIPPKKYALLAVVMVAFASLTTVIVTLLRDGSSELDAEIFVSGDGINPRSYSPSQITALPRSVQSIPGEDGTLVTYTGVDLSYLLSLSGAPIKEKLKKVDAGKYLVITGRDGFSAVFALPEFDRGRFLLVDTIDGMPLSLNDGPFRIISPDDKTRMRWIRQIKRLDIRTALTCAPLFLRV
ncbi:MULTISPECIES: hypothetical protein [unclassified Phyllobacterium]|uniref:hypothetical protein n=1 Tax=unclassified Phyllobacterium TaxID=2638441 RepID=UPI003012FE48